MATYKALPTDDEIQAAAAAQLAAEQSSEADGEAFMAGDDAIKGNAIKGKWDAGTYMVHVRQREPALYERMLSDKRRVWPYCSGSSGEPTSEGGSAPVAEGDAPPPTSEAAPF